jgi:hypothetical protein
MLHKFLIKNVSYCILQISSIQAHIECSVRRWALRKEHTVPLLSSICNGLLIVFFSNLSVHVILCLTASESHVGRDFLLTNCENSAETVK